MYGSRRQSGRSAASLVAAFGGLSTRETCKFFARTGTCRYGNGCRFSHGGAVLPGGSRGGYSSGSSRGGSSRGASPAFPFEAISLEQFSRLRDPKAGDDLKYSTVPPGLRTHSSLSTISDSFGSADAYLKTMQAHSDAEFEVRRRYMGA